MNTTTAHQWAQLYASFGLKSVPIPAGRKAPTHKGWQREENLGVPPYWTGNLGLAHAYSGTMALDVDDYQLAYWWLSERGVDLKALLEDPASVQIDSGRPGHYKLIYKLPAWSGPIAKKQITLDGHAVVDFRCATRKGLTVQDVLPPSIHPDTGRPYEWRGDWQHIPPIPDALLQAWLGALEAQPLDKPKAPKGPVNENELRSALFTLDPDMPRDQWVKVGMALHNADPELVWLWDEWSATGSKYVGDDIMPVWESFDETPGGVTVATLFRYARDKGWGGHRPLMEELFEASLAASPSVGAAAAVAALPAPEEPLTGVVEESLHRQLVREVDALDPWQEANERLSWEIQNILLRSFALTVADQQGIRTLIRRHTGWSANQLREVVRDLQKRQRELMSSRGDLEAIYAEHIYLGTLHVFMHKQSGEIYRPEALVAMHQHLSAELREQLLAGDGCVKVAGLGFDPSHGEFYEKNGQMYYNQWRGLASYGRPGDIGPWWQHLCLLVPEAREREHLLDWMAHTLQQPGEKINHGVILTGDPGIGKDTLFWPMTKALGSQAAQVQADALERDFNSWLVNAKLIVFQEPDYGSRRDAKRIATRLKNICAAPPDEIMINKKGISEFNIRNVVSVVMLSNEDDPVLINLKDRRYFVVHCPLHVADMDGETTAQWSAYFRDLWAWLTGGGWEHVVAYLLSRDLRGFAPHAQPPVTEAKRATIAATQSPFEQLLRHLYTNAVGPFAAEVATTQVLRRWFTGNDGLNYLAQYGVETVPSLPVLGREVARVLPVAMFRTRRVWGTQQAVVVFRNMDFWKDMTGDEIARQIESQPETSGLVSQ